MAVRGSSNVHDALTDLVCEPYELDELPTIDGNTPIDDVDDVAMGVTGKGSKGSKDADPSDVNIEDAYA